MNVPLLKVEELHAGYGGMPVLRDVALEVCEAEIESNWPGPCSVMNSRCARWCGR